MAWPRRPYSTWIIIRICITFYTIFGAGKQVDFPVGLIFSIYQNKVVIIRKPSGIISPGMLFVPNYICDEVITTKNFITKDFAISLFLII